MLARLPVLAAGLFAATLVMATYFPSDSVAVERGDALWLAALAIITATVTWVMPTRSPVRDIRVDYLAVSLAAWMFIAAISTANDGNLRQATNEAWLWVTGVAIFTSARRLFLSEMLGSVALKRAGLVLLVGCAVGLSVHALHQHFVSLPRMLAEYRADPDAMIRSAGLDAPAGSSARMVFENRLFDGGPVGTFALANSLAGVLLVGYLVAAGLAVIMVRRRVVAGEKVVAAFSLGCLLVGLVFSALLLTHSRSGILAAIAGSGLFAVMTFSSRWWGLAASGFAVLTGGAMSLAVFGNQEWIAQAPTSLAFRVQYWRSTWAMAVDRPGFGAGPGNFQAVYPSYREASAAETIAEPHNFFFETLASGGFIGAGLLTLLIAAIVWERRSGLRIEAADSVGSTCSNESPHSIEPRVTKGWWMGGGSALVLIGLLGLATGQSPDWEAQIIAVPVAITVMVFTWRVTKNLEAMALRAVTVTAIAGLMLHLVVSGGFTVPGVAVWLWMLAGMMAVGNVPVTGVREFGESQRAQPHRRREIIAEIVCGLSLLVLLRWLSIVPVESSAALIREATVASSTRARRDLVERASVADPWSPTAPLWAADLDHWSVLADPDAALLRKRWRASVADAIRLSGRDPSLIKLVAAGPLHVYQRWGRGEDLQWAFELFDEACQRSPTDAAALAQRAEILETLGDQSAAIADARRASELAELGENLERRLWLQPILVVKALGEAARTGPILETADKLLQNQLDFHDVQRDNR